MKKIIYIAAVLLCCTSVQAFAYGGTYGEYTLAPDTPSSAEQKPGSETPAYEDWQAHFQATGIYQAYPSFSADYSGPESLNSAGQQRHTDTATAFLGARVWNGGELYFNPEFAQGIGFDNTFGVAGFPNGDAEKSGGYTGRVIGERLFIRQTFGLGGETENIESDQNQLAGAKDISRITFTLGKLAANDIFDNNSYSHDPRTQFMNWALMDSGAWDYPADARGYTYGAVAELNQKNWALRYGAFTENQVPNGKVVNPHGFDSLGNVVELEERYKLNEMPGTTRFLVFLNSARMGTFSDALDTASTTGENVNTAIAATRKYGNIKYGFAINAEQKLTDDLGAFTRISWNNGQTEDWSFTNIDQSLAVGLSLQGKRWGRDDDTVGLAGVINGISKDQQDFLSDGGLGILIGDGKLNYCLESILETYYSYKITSYLSVTPDYQFVLNPAYNQDRGPVSIFSGRLHVEF